MKGYMVWSLETGNRLLTSSQVTFAETRYPRLMGVTEWEFSMRTKTKMCKATVSVMSFETESVDRHPFQFTDEEIRHRENETQTKLNPENLIGMTVMVEHNGKLKKGKVYNFLRAYKVWGIVLLEADEDDPSLMYVTTSQMADQNKVKFTC
jgi:hypothetical protein